MSSVHPREDPLAPPSRFSAARLFLASEGRLESAVWRLLCVFAFFVPWSIAIAEIVLAIAVAAAARHWWLAREAPPRTPLDAPILAFLGASLLAAFVGLDVGQSLWGLRTYSKIVIVYLVYARARTPERMALLLESFLAGSLLPSAHTMFNAVSPWSLPRLFPGGMTESGNLLFAIGISTTLYLMGIDRRRWLQFGFVLYGAALAANLKRGAWLGVIATLGVIGSIRSRRLILATALVLAAMVAAVGPVRSRIENTARDLLLPGNRYDIWTASVDVIRRFPLGVGRKNGTILRDYPNIPQRHKHAHNNVLQIAMENGLLGLGAFLWWMGAFARLSWRLWRRLPEEQVIARATAIACFSTFVGFHVAGLVEYNFGDSEVVQMLFVMMGLGLVANDYGNGRTV
ncbi:MAG: hypothetical protein QOD06_1781 [Candidatus Binatota bacterium]|jgi:O-antigen ligase|nr:hypothetical protein [Candidatus Binatota bacterium]